MTEEQRRVCEKAFDTLDAVDEQRAIWDAEREAETLRSEICEGSQRTDAYKAEQERLERDRFAQKRLSGNRSNGNRKCNRGCKPTAHGSLRNLN